MLFAILATLTLISFVGGIFIGSLLSQGTCAEVYDELAQASRRLAQTSYQLARVQEELTDAYCTIDDLYRS